MATWHLMITLDSQKLLEMVWSMISRPACTGTYEDRHHNPYHNSPFWVTLAEIEPPDFGKSVVWQPIIVLIKLGTTPFSVGVTMLIRFKHCLLCSNLNSSKNTILHWIITHLRDILNNCKAPSLDLWLKVTVKRGRRLIKITKNRYRSVKLPPFPSLWGFTRSISCPRKTRRAKLLCKDEFSSTNSKSYSPVKLIWLLDEPKQKNDVLYIWRLPM